MSKASLKVLILSCVLVVGPFCTVFGQDAPQGESETPNPTRFYQTQWVNPDAWEQITYQEWKAKTGEPGPFEVNFVGGSRELAVFDIGTKFCVIINDALYDQLQFSISRYVSQLTGEGYDVEVYATSGGTPDDLRDFLHTRYVSGMEGCVLIGDLPVPWYETYDCWEYPPFREVFPCDFFYMDLDGIWSDTDENGVYDTHEGDITFEIWFGRLTASTLTLDGADEISLMRNYFEKNSLYRSELRPLNNRALVYVDDDWEWMAGGESADVGAAYDDCTLVSDPWTTSAADYETRLTENYECVHLMAHSSHSTHYFYSPGGYGGTTTGSDILALDPPAYFYNLYACSVARYVDLNYLAGWYIFCPTYGLTAIGNTKIGGIGGTDNFYRPFGEGQPIGKAFCDWLTAPLAQGNDHPMQCAVYGITFLGDPTLTKKNKPERVTLDYSDETCGGGIMLPGADGSDLYNVRFTAPDSCRLYSVHFVRYLNGTPGARLYVWESDGLFPTTVIDSMDIPYAQLQTPGVYLEVYLGGMELAFGQNTDFHIGFRTLKSSPDDRFLTQTDCGQIPLEEYRSTLFLDGAWQTLYDYTGQERNFRFNLEVAIESQPPLAITPVLLPDGEVGQPYYETLEATGGVPPYSWEFVVGTLPDGVVFDPLTASVSGTPTLAGTGRYAFTVRATDADNPAQTDIQHLTIFVPYCHDGDGDGFGDPEHPENTCVTDNCPLDYNPDQEDVDGDGIGDSCEVLRTWRVQADGLGDIPTIQLAIDSCTHGDTVLVADGVYAGSGNRDIEPRGRRILIRSENGPDFTIIDCQGSPTEPHRAFVCQNGEDSSTVIEGFTIRGGVAPEYQGTSSGGGILAVTSAPTIKNCIFAGDSAILGGAVFAYDADPRFINCTFYGNAAPYGSAILIYNRSHPTLENCILAFNRGSVPFYCIENSSAVLSCCNIYGNAFGDWVSCIASQGEINGNLSAHPMFCDTAAADFHVADDSPCAPANNSCATLIGAMDVGCTYVCVDADEDGFGDPDHPENMCSADNCPAEYNPDQTDTDGDGAGDACDDDDDDDEIPDSVDNCPLVANPGQDNNDGDEHGDACDDDDDNDGVADQADNCPFAYNPGQVDTDGDGLGDACDPCECTGFGDLDLDGGINPVDVVHVVNYVYKNIDGREQLPGCPKENGDWNCDDAVNPMDVVSYVNHVYKSIGSGPCDPCALMRF